MRTPPPALPATTPTAATCPWMPASRPTGVRPAAPGRRAAAGTAAISRRVRAASRHPCARSGRATATPRHSPARAAREAGVPGRRPAAGGTEALRLSTCFDGRQGLATICVESQVRAEAVSW